MEFSIQNNIKNSDFAHDISLRIDFIKEINQPLLELIISKIDESLLKNIGVCFGASWGSDFVTGFLPDFGSKSSFSDLKDCIHEVLNPFDKYVKIVFFTKTEYTQANFNFISKKEIELETILKQSRTVFPEIFFKPISYSNNSSEWQYFSGSDADKTVTLFVSEIKYNKKDWFRFSIGCKRLTKKEIEQLLEKINQIHLNSRRIKWNGLNYNQETESWSIPKHYQLFEFITNDVN